jgi:hypothetical protein
METLAELGEAASIEKYVVAHASEGRRSTSQVRWLAIRTDDLRFRRTAHPTSHRARGSSIPSTAGAGGTIRRLARRRFDGARG